MSIITPPVEVQKPRVDSRAAAAARELHERLQSVRRRSIAQMIWIGLGAILSLVAVSLAVVATADYWWELTVGWRAFGLTAIIAGATVAGVLGWGRWITRYSLSRAAKDAEARFAQFGQRLRTNLDYEDAADHIEKPTRPAAASPALLAALHAETDKVARYTDWDDAVNPQPLFITLLATFFIGFVWLVAMAAVPEFRTATGRALLLPLDYTTVTYSPQTATVRFGESVIVKATVAGRPIAAAELRYRPSGTQDAWKTLTLAPVNLTSDETLKPEKETEKTTETSGDTKPKDPLRLLGEFQATLWELERDVEFAVVAGPRELPAGSIRVLQPLKLEKSQAKIVPPSYTGRKPQTVEALDLKVLEGSTVELKLQLNRAASSAKLVRVASSSKPEKPDESPQVAEIPLTLQDNTVSGTLADLRHNGTFTFSAQAADGMLLDPVRISIRVQLDRKPQVEFIQPPEELVVTPTTEVPMLVESKDDLGLHKVGILYQVGSGSMQVLAEQDAGGSAEPFRLDPVLMLEKLQVTHQDAVTYYAFAEDNYFGKPRRTTTPLRFIDIRPFKMKFQVVDEQGEPCNCTSITLEELIARQRMGLKQAFTLQDQSAPAKATTERLSKSQSEVLTATKEFADGMAARGAKLPTLDDAMQAMEQAVAALDAPKLSAAVTAEQQALAGLIRARENVRQTLNQSSSPSASAARKFDRQQRQKLRLPEKKPEDRQEQLAQAREKLENLAKRERKWSEEAQQSCNCANPSSSGKSGKPSQSESKSSESKPSSSQQAQSPPQGDPQKSAENPLQNGGDKSQVPTPAEIAEAQKKLQAELAELQEQLKKLDQNGQSAQQQAQQAAESMQQGADAVQKQDGEAAAIAGRRSADQLDQLSEHLAALNARDFGQRLDQAQKLAQQLASRQEGLQKKLGDAKGEDASKSSPETDGKNETHDGGKPGTGGAELAQDERSLATQTEMLAELLDKLQPDADTETGAVREKLEQVQSENPPRDIAATMRQAADDLQAGRQHPAGRGVAQAKDRLNELSKSLGAARAEYAQPQLKELLALEEQLAQLQQQLKRAQSQGNEEAAALKQKWQQLEARMDQLAEGDKRLAEALRQLREGPPAKNASEEKGTDGKPASESSDKPGSANGGKTPPKPGSQLRPTEFTEGGQQTPEGHYSWLELGDFKRMQTVAKALQTKIQEAILAGALQDADQPVPPAYKELVEKYYRTLSDDLK